MKFFFIFGVCLTILAKKCQETYGHGVNLNDGLGLKTVNVQVEEESSQTYETYESSDSTTSSNGFSSDVGVADLQLQLGKSLGTGISSNGVGLDTLTGGNIDLQKQVGNFQTSASSYGDNLQGSGLNSLTGQNLNLQKQLGNFQSNAASFGDNLKGSGLNSLAGGNLDLQKQLQKAQSSSTNFGGNDINKLATNFGDLGAQNLQAQNQYSETYDITQKSSSYNYDDLNQGSVGSDQILYSPQVKLNGDGKNYGYPSGNGLNQNGVTSVAYGAIPTESQVYVGGSDYNSKVQDLGKLGQGIAYQPLQGISLPQTYVDTVQSYGVITESYDSSDESGSDEKSGNIINLPGSPLISPPCVGKHHKKPHSPPKKHKSKGPCHKKHKKPKHLKKSKSCHKCKKPEVKKSKCGCN